jgi:hypothetical protein
VARFLGFFEKSPISHFLTKKSIFLDFLKFFFMQLKSIKHAKIIKKNIFGRFLTSSNISHTKSL